LAGVARAVGSALWPGLSADRESAGWDALALGGPAPARWAWRRLPWLAGLYALVVVIAAAGGVINSSHRGNGGVAFLLLLPFVGGLALAARRPRDGWRVVTLWLLVTPFLVAPPARPVPPLEAWRWCLWVPALLLVGMAGPGPVVAAVGVVSALVLLALTLLTSWPVDPGYLTLSVAGVAVALVVGASVGAGVTSRRARRCSA
jgi:hypothetical protein